MTPLIQILKADLEQEAKATPAPWIAETSTPEDCVLWGPSPEDKFLANVGSDNIVPIATTDQERAEARVLFDIDVNNANLTATARNHHKPYVVALLKIAELTKREMTGMFDKECREELYDIRAALAELAEALGASESEPARAATVPRVPQ